MTELFTTFVQGWVAAGGEAGAIDKIVAAFNAAMGTSLVAQGDCVDAWIVDQDEIVVATFDGVDREWHEC